MHPVLSDILAAKKRELNEKNARFCTNQLKSFDVRDFKRAIDRPGRMGIIAEIKSASPSVGVIRRNTDPVQIAQSYEKAGVAAVSVVTEKEFFNGSAETLPAVRTAVSIPVLRKDFILDESQIYESLELGADAVLLIAGILPPAKLEGFLNLCRRLKMAALTEVHSEQDMEKAAFCGADIIGINNRSLATFEVSLDTTLRLAPMVPSGCCFVSESGIRSPGDLPTLQNVGVSAVLVGTALMESADPGEAAGRLVQAGIMVRKGEEQDVQS